MRRSRGRGRFRGRRPVRRAFGGRGRRRSFSRRRSSRRRSGPMRIGFRM